LIVGHFHLASINPDVDVDVDRRITTMESRSSSGYSSDPSISSGNIKRKPVHVVKPLSGSEIRSRLKISKRDIIIARKIVNNIRHK